MFLLQQGTASPSEGGAASAASSTATLPDVIAGLSLSEMAAGGNGSFLAESQASQNMLGFTKSEVEGLVDGTGRVFRPPGRRPTWGGCMEPGLLLNELKWYCQGKHGRRKFNSLIRLFRGRTRRTIAGVSRGRLRSGHTWRDDQRHRHSVPAG